MSGPGIAAMRAAREDIPDLTVEQALLALLFALDREREDLERCACLVDQVTAVIVGSCT